MFNPEKLLGGLIRSSTRGRGGLGGLVSGGVALGALGVAMEAFEHFMKNPQGAGVPQQRMGGSPPPMPGRTPPPPPANENPGTPPTMPPMPGKSPPGHPPEADGESEAVLLIRAMIASANADGMIDKAERDAILGRLQAADLSAEEHAFITRELLAPADLETIAGNVDSADMARRVYAVSLMAIEVDTEAERRYMKDLAGRLGLDEADVEQIKRNLEVD